MDPNVRHCFAKINLALSVAPPEPAGTPRAGWHRIASWMHAIALHDDLTVERTDGDGLELERSWAPDAPRPDPIDWPVEQDLVWRAHALLAEKVGEPLGARIELTKRIPAGSGMGGGSSNAASTFIALNELFALGLSLDELRALSSKLGSDIAFFIDDEDPPRPALVSGFAESIERLSRSSAEVLLLVPGFGCGTRAVYRAYDEGGPTELEESRVRALAEGPLVAGSPFNDLAGPAERVEPRLGELRSRLADELGVPVHVTGSGSTMFVVGEGRELDRLAGVAEASGVAAVRSRLV